MAKSRYVLIYLFVLVGVLPLLTNSCKKDDNNPTGGSTVTDIDGNVYHTVKIGTQIWMAENLKTTRYRDSTSIQNVTGNTAWNNLTSGAYCDYENDSSNSETYGRLYNWYAVHNPREYLSRRMACSDR